MELKEERETEQSARGVNKKSKPNDTWPCGPPVTLRWLHGVMEKARLACRGNGTVPYPLCTAARHPVLLRTRMVNMQKKKKKHAMPKQTL